MENARVAAVKVEAVAEQENNKFEQNKVSVVTEKKKVADIQVNQIVKAVAKKTNIRNQGKRVVQVVIENKEESLAEVGKEAKQDDNNSAVQNKVSFAAEGKVVAKPVEDVEEIIELI